MKKGRSSLVQTLAIVGTIAVISLLITRGLNGEFSLDGSMKVDVAEIGQRIVSAVIDAIASLINPDRQA